MPDNQNKSTPNSNAAGDLVEQVGGFGSGAVKAVGGLLSLPSSNSKPSPPKPENEKGLVEKFGDLAKLPSSK